MRRPDALYPAVTLYLVYNKNVDYYQISLSPSSSNSEHANRNQTKMTIHGFDDDDVVISGISMHFPGAVNFKELQEKLTSSMKIQAKANISFADGHLDELGLHGRIEPEKFHFDNTCFGIGRLVSKNIAFASRKVLERSFEALLDAGMNPEDCRKCVCAMYENTAFCDGELANDSMYSLEKFGILGKSRALAANRVSFFFGATGTSASVDCGFLGGMNNLQSAVDEIKNGYSDMAVVSSASTYVGECSEIQINDFGWLSKDGRTRSFDNDADGYFRSEGSCSIILQRAKDARRIYAKIHNVIVRSSTIDILPYSQSQRNWEDVLSEFYRKSNISANDISYLEAYGSGIKEMDAAELNAVANVICAKRDNPLLVGSIKSNIGHTDGACDLASIMNALVCFESGYIPITEGYSSPNRQVPSLINGKIQVVKNVTPLPEKALIAISGWTFGSIYGHLILERFNKPKINNVSPIPRLVPLCARTSEFLTRTINTIEKMPYDPEYYALVTDVFTRKIDQYLGKGYVILPKGEISNSLCESENELNRPLWFVFSGMGSQWAGMGKGLMNLPICKESFERSQRVMEPFGVDLMDIITSDDATTFDNILNSFVGIAAIQIALVDVMNALKLVPSGIIGHSVGELGCAYADGALTAEQTILCAYYRGRASCEAKMIKGCMAAIGQGYQEIKDKLPEGIEVACHNSSTSCTLSGPADLVVEYVEELKKSGVFARSVNVANIAYHSQYIKPAAPILLEYLKKVITNPKPRSEKWISTSVPEESWNTDLGKYCSAEYNQNNLLSSVLFEEGCRHIPDNAVLVEIAPHGLLNAILKRSMGKNVINIPLTNRSAKESDIFLLKAIGQIFTAGFKVDINALYPKVDYPVSRGTAQIQQLIFWLNSQLGEPKQDLVAKSDINIRKELAKCDSTKSGYRLNGRYIFPLSYYVQAVDSWKSQCNAYRNAKSTNSLFHDLRFNNPTALSPISAENVQIARLPYSNIFELTSSLESIAAGEIHWLLESDPLPELVELKKENDILMTLEKDEIYACFEKAGLEIPNDYRSLVSCDVTPGGLIGHISQSMSFNARLEGVLQMFMLDTYNHSQKIVFPHLIREMLITHNEKQPNTGTMEVIFDRTLKLAYSSEFKISDVSYKELVFEKNDSLLLHSINYVAYDSPDLPSSDEFIRFCCNVIKKTKKVDEEMNVLELVENFPEWKTVIESASPTAQVVVKTPKDAGNSDGFDLVVCSSRELVKVASNSNGFILVQGHSPITIPADFVQVSNFKCEKTNQFWLLRKKIVLNGERNFIKITQDKETLLNELRTRRSKSTVLLVGYNEPKEGIARYQEIIESSVDMKLKWLFILDKTAPEFNIATALYQEQLKQGLSTNVLLKGKWHHVYKAKINPVVEEKENAEMSALDTLPSKNANTKKNKQTMGILSDDLNATLDPLLSWPLPESWTEEDAKSVPFAFSMAYYCLSVVVEIKKFDGILVTDGLSVSGQAAIAVALTLTDRVYAAVASAEESVKLRKLFPKLEERSIVFHTDKDLGLRLKLLYGDERPNIVYNCLDGDCFKTCFQNMPLMSTIFHFGREDIIKNTIITMGPFKSYVSLYAVSRDSIKTWTTAEKQIVQKLVANGIENGIVKPAVSFAPSMNNEVDSLAKQITKAGHKIQHLASKWQRGSQFIVSACAIYVVVGINSDLELDIAEWLARRGAKKIYVCNPTLNDNAQYQRKVQGLKLRRNIMVEVFDQHGLKKAIRDNNNIEAIFFVDLVEDAAQSDLSFFEDLVGTETKHLVTMLRSREYVLKMHKTSEIRGAYTNIIWNVDDVLIGQSMDLIAPFFGNHPTISVESDKETKAKKRAESWLLDLIPTTMDGYLRLGASIKTLPDFVEISNKALRSSDRQEILPVFVIAGLEDEPVELVTPILQELMYPAFVATLPHNGLVSVPNTAATLIPIMKKLSSKTAFNVVGLTTGCPIALEVARQLNNQGITVSLLLVDNPVDSLREGFSSPDQLQTNLLNALAALCPKPLEEVLRGPLPWPARLNHLISLMDLPSNSDQAIRQAACYIYDRFTAMLHYDMSTATINGPLTILRSQDSLTDFNPNLICSLHATVDVPMNRKELMMSEEIGQIINKSAITETMICKRVDWITMDVFYKYALASLEK